ncbi:hypothetical protein ApDm4_1720 [Acetobacter pomorum]|nr:hypothetical protein ApDm4_1720 [Acetobacter pomorum]
MKRPNKPFLSKEIATFLRVAREILPEMNFFMKTLLPNAKTSL